MSRLTWGRRLLATQVVILTCTGLVAVLTAAVIGPRLFAHHLQQAGESDPVVNHHAQQAFRDAGLASLAVGLVVATTVAGVTTWLLSRALRGSVDALSQGASRVARGDYTRPVVVPRAGAELARVATQFNRMAEQVANTESTRRQMLTDLGHELRTPLAATRMTLEGLEDGVVDFTAETLAVLKRQNLRLTALADDIADVSRAQEEQLSWSSQRLLLGDLVGQTAAAWRERVTSAGVRLEVHAPADSELADIEVDVDPHRLQQVLDNLVRNAFQHTPAGGLIVIEADGDATRPRIVVRDDGDGIPTHELPHVFERFFHGSHPRVRDHDQGTGVGLTISRAILRAHGGDLLVASDGPGRGAQFTVVLP